MALLEGIKVVEVAIYAFVPSAGAALADWGADVIKIEHPETGDPMRGLSSYGIKPGDGGVTALWEVFNRGKRSVGININDPEGLKLLMALIDDADVFITNFMQPARQRLGIDVDQVLARNPRIIYGRGTGQGPLGPDANKGGFDGLSYWGRPGVSTAAMPPDYDFPVMLPGPAFGDVQSGMNMAGGIAAALYRREKTGKGGVVDVSLLGSGLWAMQATIAGAYATGRDNIIQHDRYRPPNPLANMYRSADDRFFLLGMLEADRYWPGLCVALDQPDLAIDERFASMKSRAANSEACVQALDAVFAKMPLTEVFARLNSQEGQWSTVELPGDTVKDEQSLANGYIQMVKFENGADLPFIPAPASADGEAPVLTRAPEHCEHTDEVIGALGHSMDELIDLKVAGVIA
jgi:crotonobetainyl-CoA:carnitine CoA-transferase CaiB-like acyl-CoA transferase